MKLLSRNYNHRNLIIFMMLSLVYLQAIDSLSSGESLFTKQSLLSFFIDHYLICSVGLLAVYRVVMLRRFSEWFLLASLVLIVGENFVLLSGSFNKLVLVLNFIYLMFAFYFYVTWELEVSLACFNPRFSRYDLVKKERFPLTAEIRQGEDVISSCVYVTNIDQESCFLLFPEGESVELNPKKNYTIVATLESVSFVQTAQVVSRYDRGYGLSFKSAPNARVSWSELYKVCLQRSYVS